MLSYTVPIFTESATRLIQSMGAMSFFGSVVLSLRLPKTWNQMNWRLLVKERIAIFAKTGIFLELLDIIYVNIFVSFLG